MAAVLTPMVITGLTVGGLVIAVFALIPIAISAAVYFFSSNDKSKSAAASRLLYMVPGAILFASIGPVLNALRPIIGV